jgi:hypothetical protein
MRFLVDHLRVHAIYRRDLEKRKVSLDWIRISGDWLLTSWTNFLRSGGICGSTCIFFSLATKL